MIRPADTPDDASGRGARTLRVLAAPPLLTVQDLGRPGNRAAGLPAGGAMDPWAIRAANALAGNDEGAAALEWAGGDGAVRCDGDVCLALAGADVDVAIDGRGVAAGRTVHAPAGSLIEVRGTRSGLFLYLAVAGGIAVPTVLGGSGTYLPAALGGLEGRRLRAGDVLHLGHPPAAVPHAGFVCPPDLLDPVPAPAGVIRVVRGPQAAMLDDRGWSALLGTEGFHVGRASDRVGYRLSGTPVVPAAPRDLPSEPACPGAIQLPPDGQPIVLMADAPTVGGYPKPAIVCRADLGRLAQCPPGSVVRFALIELAEAQRLYRRRRVAAWTVGELAVRNG